MLGHLSRQVQQTLVLQCLDDPAAVQTTVTLHPATATRKVKNNFLFCLSGCCTAELYTRVARGNTGSDNEAVLSNILTLFVQPSLTDLGTLRRGRVFIHFVPPFWIAELWPGIL